MREKFREEFIELHMRFLAKCERTVVAAALGHLDLESKATTEQVKHAKWVLERQATTWNKTQKLAIEDKRPRAIDITPDVQSLLEAHDRQAGFVRIESPRRAVLSAYEDRRGDENHRGEPGSGGDSSLHSDSISKTPDNDPLV